MSGGGIVGLEEGRRLVLVMAEGRKTAREAEAAPTAFHEHTRRAKQSYTSLLP
jgi:hypothetical protein